MNVHDRSLFDVSIQHVDLKRRGFGPLISLIARRSDSIDLRRRNAARVGKRAISAVMKIGVLFDERIVRDRQIDR